MILFSWVFVVMIGLVGFVWCGGLSFGFVLSLCVLACWLGLGLLCSWVDCQIWCEFGGFDLRLIVEGLVGCV